jgi:hypothetical protein
MYDEKSMASSAHFAHVREGKERKYSQLFYLIFFCLFFFLFDTSPVASM